MNVFEPSTTVMSKEDTMIHFLGVAMIQKHILKKVPKKFVARGENSVTKELTQLHDMQTYFPLDANTLTK